MGSFTNMLMRFAKKQAKKAIKDLGKPSPAPKAKQPAAQSQQPAPTPAPALTIYIGDSCIDIERNGREWFSCGDIVARNGDLGLYLADGFRGESSYLMLVTESEIVAQKKYDDMVEVAFITPQGVGVVVDGEKLHTLSAEKNSSREFLYADALDEMKIANDDVIAYVEDGEDYGTMTLKCFRLDDLSTWSRKMKFNDDLEGDEVDTTLVLNDGVFEVTMPDGSTCRYTTAGEKMK